VLAIVRPVFVLWRSHARSEVVPFVICGGGWLIGLVCVFHHLAFVFRSCTLCRVFLTYSAVWDLEKKLSLMSPPR